MLKRGLRVTVSFLLAAGFLLLFFWKLDFRRILEHMGEARPIWLGAAVVAQLIHLTLRSYRWRILVSPMRRGVGFYNLFSATAIGYLLSFVLFRVGEVVRPMMLAQREGISRSGTLATCVLERLMDFLSVGLLLGVYLVFFFSPPEAGTGALDMERVRQAGLLLGAGALSIFPALYFLVHYRQRIFNWLNRRSSGESSLLSRLLHSFLGGFDAIKEGWAFALAWTQSIAIWLVIAASIWVSLRAFDLTVGFTDSLLMMALLTIGIAVPTPGGVGSYEYAGQLGLTGMFGVEANRAAATILVTHAFAIGPVMILGAILLWKEGLTLRSLSRITREAAPAGAAARAPGASR
ncbi:MAG TPA: lysylphosphatidylglycerol synthase transmembrane domain-containing protein [Candidatus Polarisedimenticolia bacterium]|nr:lysylphosphatidylglycerol synthase transmembrane domain-containing protein [Candidatus Polarisedimenticolia bacterium]